MERGEEFRGLILRTLQHIRVRLSHALKNQGLSGGEEITESDERKHVFWR